MRLIIVLSLLLCLTVVSAQVAVPVEDLRGWGGRDKDKGKDKGKGKGKGKGDKEPVNGGVEALKKRIGDLQEKVAKANDTIVPFKGGSLKGLVGLLKVNEAVVTLGTTIDRGTKSAEATNTLSATESTQVGTQFLALQPDINNLLAELQGKRKEFDKAGFKILDVRSLIRDSVEIQKDKANDLGGAFTKVLDRQFQPIGVQISDQIQGNFSRTIDEYEGRGGKIKIPSKAVPKLTDLLAGVARALGVTDNDRMMAAGPGPVPEVNTVPLTNFPNVEAAFADISAADTPQANSAIEAAIRGTSDMELSRLGRDENDLRGIPPLVLAVLRRYDVI
ncbi:antigenic cell wall protein [Colletotrichum tofieldiae]|nr:antigenic cell wall protein [Colletotrichum tofieldiae]GKT77114.1 antigenic cell wall protein [Colletotrichum tofieldiae]